MATVRRAPSGGLNVRSGAASATILTTLNQGDLMYDIIGVPSVTATLNGIEYIWIKIHYYKSRSHNSCEEGEGWVTTTHANAVSSTVPTSSDTYFSNSYLKQNEMLVNARYIFKLLREAGWKLNPIFAVLGNMERESTINPGLFNELDTSSNVYGLTQWYPKSKLLNWLTANSLSDNIDNQVGRIIYEANNEEQWIKANDDLNISFSEFTVSTASYSALADCFLHCYEVPGNFDTESPIRQANASKWSTLIGLLGY